MPRYCVNATIDVAAWVYVEADTPEEALEEARSMSADLFETDTGTALVEFNVEPDVEEVP